LTVSLNNFTVKYGDITAVDSITLSFSPGATGLLGVNGAGKSSLIKGLLGLVRISGGSASLLGHDISREQKSIRRLIGYMPEDDCIIPGLSGLEMVQYAGQLSGMSARDARQRAHEVLFLVGLEEARYRRVEGYSSGMKQRIKLAQALVHDPRLLFLDEPTSGMDPRGRNEMLDLISSISGSVKISIILATHILSDVEKTCDRIVIIHRGRLARRGDTADIRGSYSGAFTVKTDGDGENFSGKLRERGCAVSPSGRELLDVTLPDGEDTDLILRKGQQTSGLYRNKIQFLAEGIQGFPDQH
jgi:ABC-2 type transport system ATP-binding protein